MARATAAETAERVDALQMKLLAGEPNAECLAYARQQWGLSRACDYELLKRAWVQIEGDLVKGGGPNSKRELLAWSIQPLMAAAGQAKEQKIPERWWRASVRQLDWMVGMGINSATGQRVHRSRL